MGSKNKFLAIDLGASTGRGIVGEFVERKIVIHEVSRFNNQIVKIFGGNCWNIYDLYEKIKVSIKKAFVEYEELSGIGIDSWGLDFVFLDKYGNIIGLPNTYRDSRTDGMPEKFFNEISKEVIYKETGIQFLKINTLYQIYSYRIKNPDMFQYVDKILFLPDYLNYLFTGKQLNEYTISSTSQILKADTKNWSDAILKSLGISKNLFCNVSEPGSVIGEMHATIKEELNVPRVDFLLIPSHDTASAIVAVPAKEKDWAYLSSGTWSLIGAELDEPVINEDTYKNNFTNEGGAFNKIRFLKNISGMWLLQESKRIWEERGIKCTYDDLIENASKAKPFQGFIDPDADIFLKPDNMLVAINEFLLKSGQEEVKDQFSIVRIILESLALKYREVIEILQKLINKNINVLHIIGGGSQNDLLNQMTAESTGLKIVAGPIEATAIGNLLMQAKAKGVISTLEEARETVRNSFKLKEFIQTDGESWNVAYNKYRSIKIKSEELWKN